MENDGDGERTTETESGESFEKRRENEIERLNSRVRMLEGHFRNASRSLAEKTEMVNSLREQVRQLTERNSELEERVGGGNGSPATQDAQGALRPERGITVVIQKRNVRNPKKWSETEKQMISELGVVIRRDLARKFKFLPDGWEMWGTDTRSVCGRVMQNYDFQGKEAEARKVWHGVLQPNIPLKYTEYKNRIGTAMKGEFKGKILRMLSGSESFPYYIFIAILLSFRQLISVETDCGRQRK
jgi:hypothetical protein